jgi:hypothetical protein
MIRTSLTLLAALTLGGTTSAQFVMMTNSTLDTLVTFSPVDGSIITQNLFAIPNTVQVSAIDVNGEIWISEQTGDRVVRYDIAGNVLGQMGPTFAGGGLDNIRGMAYVNGLVYVTNSGTANGAPGNAIVVFDPAGNYVTQFTTNALATSPFSIIPWQGDLLVSGSSNNHDVYRFTTGGTPVASFHNSATISFAHQLAPASDGNVWCTGFTTGGLTKLDAATGAVITTIPASGARGVFELLNGNLLWTNGSGAHIYDVATQTSTNILAGGSYHLNLYGAAASMSSTNVFGTGCDGLTFGTSGLPRIGNATFGLRVDNVPAISPIAFVAFGTMAFNPGIDLTGIGMAGCFSYQSLDLGMFATDPVASASATLILPIPLDTSLTGTTLAAQGVSFSLATTFGFATSNGLTFSIGY